MERAAFENQADAIVARPDTFDLRTLHGMGEWGDWVFEHSLGCSGVCPMGSLGSELAETDSEARAHIAEGFKRWETSIRRGLQEMHAPGRSASKSAPDALALAILAAHQGGLLLTQIERNTKPLEAALDAMLDLLSRIAVRD